MAVYGLTISTEYMRATEARRDLIAEPLRSPAGNVALRIGTENPGGDGWHQIGYVVLTPDEARGLAAKLAEATS